MQIPINCWHTLPYPETAAKKRAKTKLGSLSLSRCSQPIKPILGRPFHIAGFDEIKIYAYTDI